tara:strand:+ start:2402 stop:3097 length:696 start_codon:yes stop_codon:yes gene_type:complete
MSLAASPSLVKDVGQYPRLNSIVYTTSMDEWVSTDTANVSVVVNGSLQQADAAKLQSDVLANLKQLSAAGKWRITQFNRSKDQSDLERVTIVAEARLPQAQLANLRDDAKKLSKPGVKYEIQNIDFSPSDADVQATKDKLRDKIYAKVKKEVDRLDNVYTEEHFYVNRLVVGEGDFPMMDANAGMMGAAGPAQAAKYMVAARQAPRANTSVSQKITLNAYVVIASTVANPQ